MKVKYLSQKEFEYIYGRVPRLCVEAVIKTDKGMIFTKRNIEPASGKWHIPGATLLKGESIKSSVKRIIKKELGIDVRVIKMLGINEYKFKNYKRQDIAITFLAEPVNKNFKFKIDKHTDDVGIFNKLPKNFIKQQADFLKKQNLI
ncbi:MAG TPA: NUDIX hydrolase [bacterium]|nr:NUDIX hydrolase [bacterium]